MSIVAAVGGHKVQVQMKTKASSTVMKAERNTFALPRLVFGLFLRSVKVAP